MIRKSWQLICQLFIGNNILVSGKRNIYYPHTNWQYNKPRELLTILL